MKEVTSTRPKVNVVAMIGLDWPRRSTRSLQEFNIQWEECNWGDCSQMRLGVFEGSWR